MRCREKSGSRSVVPSSSSYLVLSDHTRDTRRCKNDRKKDREQRHGKEQLEGTKGKRDGRIEDRREKDRVVERWIEG